MTKLFNLIITLNQEEQRFLLKNVERLILKEKRAAARKICRLSVRYFYNEQIYNDFIANISRTGCFIETQKPLLVGDKILMDVLVNSEEKPIRINGEVANSNRFGSGIEFEKVDTNLSKALSNLLYSLR